LIKKHNATTDRKTMTPVIGTQTTPLRRAARRLVSLLTLALGLTALHLNAATQTWLGSTNLVDWGNNANWSPGVYPNSADEVVLVTNVSNIQFSNGVEQVTFGSLIFSNVAPATSGALTLGNPNQAGVVLTAQTTTGKPQFYVGTNGGHFVFFYASNLAGTQGYDKTGPGKFTFRFNTNAHPYTGDINILGGILGINQNSSLGNDNNDIAIANGARLTYEPGPGSGTTTLPSTRTITLTGAQSQMSATAAGATLIVEGPVTEDAAGKGLVKVDAGKLVLAGTVSYSGETRIAGGTLALSNTAALPAGQNLRFTASGTALDVGGTAQTVRTLVMDNVIGTKTITGGGSLTINGDAVQLLNGTNGANYNFSGLNSLTYDRINREYKVECVNAATLTTVVDNTLATNGIDGGYNLLRATRVVVGGGNSAGNNGNTARLHLGTTNVINAGTFQLGAFNAGGVVDFAGGLVNPSLKLRGTNSTDPMPLWLVGETSSGTRRGEGVANLTGGNLDADVTTLKVSRHIAFATTTDNSSLTMAAGNLLAQTILLSEKFGTEPVSGVSANQTNTSTLTANINQNGGTVKAAIITLGTNNYTPGAQNSTNTAILNPTYNLNGGELFVGTINCGSGTPNGPIAPNSVRSLKLNGGTLRNYDSSNDLNISGLNTTPSDLLNVVLEPGAQTVNADAARTITFAFTAPISGSGGLTKEGAGRLLLNGVNTYIGETLVNTGSLGGTGVISGPVTIQGSAVLSPGTSVGTLTISNDLTIAGNLFIELDKSLPTSNDQVVVTGLLQNTGTGTLTVTNVGAVPLAAGDTFAVFNQAVANGNALTISGPAGVTWSNNLAVNGTISVASIPASQPTLSFEVDGSDWVFTWLGTGFKLQVQTNLLSVGLRTNWVDVPGGNISGVSVAAPVKSNPAVFYRLISTP